MSTTKWTILDQNLHLEPSRISIFWARILFKGPDLPGFRIGLTFFLKQKLSLKVHDLAHGHPTPRQCIRFTDALF